ncbi:hypothetical protein D3C81_519810 [compost metagenome]
MKPIYTGIFFNEKTYNEMKKQSSTKVLNKRIENPHVTLEFKPKNLLPSELVGQEIDVFIVGEGNDGMNHGYEVVIPETLREYYHGSEKVHVTMSIDQNGKPVNTGSIEFKKRNSFVVTGRIGYFTKEGVVFNGV